MNILVVDDIGYSRHNLAMVLTRLGHHVLQAESGDAGLSILRQDSTVDVVITDLIMGDMDGVDFFINAKRLQRVDDQGKAFFPSFVLLTSAQPGRPAATQSILNRLKLASEIGFSKILFKPINPKAIEETLNELRSGKTEPGVDVIPLIGHLETVTQKLIREGNFEDAEKLRRSLQEQLHVLEQAAVLVES
ncbi:MAG: response regulator [Planctomycetaceae bacterium]|jgi:CheY-like chemotaxis protein|nr:response regulator [Planctomycetaceae bacterium]MBT6154105.1 response regulator [Planctomycetaceae bacterium]MBT6486340.1 response regulator [Planctomycetaceae bacterium]MBT6493260.1 response regulator [Planctomycetaceae bacterium]